MTDLNELLERVSSATGPDRELDRDICIELAIDMATDDGAVGWKSPPHFTASTDAALALVERVLPAGWPDVLREAISELSRRHSWNITFPVAGQREELSLAILAALLSALISKESQS